MHKIAAQPEGASAADETRVSGLTLGFAAAWAALYLVFIIGGLLIGPAPVHPDRSASIPVTASSER